MPVICSCKPWPQKYKKPTLVETLLMCVDHLNLGYGAQATLTQLKPCDACTALPSKQTETSDTEQFLKGSFFRLPHFKAPHWLAPARRRVVNALWGIDGQAPPVLSWAEVNIIAHTGYQSFEDAFGSTTARDNVIERISYGKYRIRRQV